jgi:hypothetical protein
LSDDDLAQAVAVVERKAGYAFGTGGSAQLRRGAVGLTPARRGQPGYWPKHDRDQDGWACEPWSGR